MGQENGLPLNETTIAEHLSSLNYSCHAIGKVCTPFPRAPGSAA